MSKGPAYGWDPSLHTAPHTHVLKRPAPCPRHLEEKQMPILMSGQRRPNPCPLHFKPKQIPGLMSVMCHEDGLGCTHLTPAARAASAASSASLDQSVRRMSVKSMDAARSSSTHKGNDMALAQGGRGTGAWGSAPHRGHQGEQDNPSRHTAHGTRHTVNRHTSAHIGRQPRLTHGSARGVLVGLVRHISDSGQGGGARMALA